MDSLVKLICPLSFCLSGHLCIVGSGLDICACLHLLRGKLARRHTCTGVCLLVKAGTAGAFRCQQTFPLQAFHAWKIPQQGVSLNFKHNCPPITKTINYSISPCWFIIILYKFPQLLSANW